MTNKNYPAKKAFSLIELSIVVLIIGILVAGITQSSRLVSAFRLSTARNLTNASPVNSVKDLVFWLDATSEKSILNQNSSLDISHGDTVSSWQDSNPTVINKTSCTQATQANQPTYITNAINGIPGIRFNSSNGSMRMSCSLASGTRMSVTIFIVFNWTSSFSATNTNFLVIGAGNASTTLNSVTTGGLFTHQTWDGSTNVDVLSRSLTVGKNLIFTIHTDPTNNSSVLYENGTSVSTATASFSGVFPDTSVTIGNWPNATRTLGGDLGEIIIFDRALKTEERKSIENYLGQKWGINVAN